MARENNLEIKVGAFVVAAVVALVAFIFSISDFSIFQKGTDYRAVFQYANGLKKGAPVRVAGVDAGHVRGLKVFYDVSEGRSKVDVDIWLMEGVRIPRGSTFMINQLGILGEKYLEIVPAVAQEFAPADTVFLGEDPVPMEEVMKMLSGIAVKLDGTLSGINDGILSEANKKAFAEMLQNAVAVTSMLRNPDGTVGRFLTDASVYKNLDEMTADLKANPWKLFYRPKGK